MSRRSGWILLAITALGAVMRLWTLGTKSMWIDEGLTALCAQSFPIAFDQCWNVGVNSPGTIFLTVLPYGLWTDDFGLRLVPAIFGIASIPSLYFLVRRWSTEPGALCAAALLALSPLQLHHSQDARAYSVMIFCSIVSTLALDGLYDGWQRALPARSLLPWAGSFVLVTLLNLYNHYLAILLLAAHLAWILVRLALPGTRARSAAALRVGLLLAAIAAGFSPWLSPVMVLANQAWVKAPLNRTPVEAVKERNMPGDSNPQWSSGKILQDTLQRLVTKWTQGIVPPPGDGRPVWVFSFVLALAGAVVLVLNDRLRALLPILILLSGFSYVFVAAVPLMIYSKMYLYTRHVVFAYPMFVAFQGIALGELWKRKKALFAVIGGILFFTLVQSLVTYYTYNKQDWRRVSAYIADNARTGDVVVVDCADWAFLAYLQRAGFRFDYKRVQGTDLRRGETVLTYRYPTHALDRSKRIWWIHEASGPQNPEMLNPEHLRYETPWGFLGGPLQVYEHPPQTP